MSNTQMISVKDTRDNLAELLEQVAIANRQFVITKFGKPKAKLVSVGLDLDTKKREGGILATAGAWKHRTDIKDSAKWAADLRRRMSNRLR